MYTEVYAYGSVCVHRKGQNACICMMRVYVQQCMCTCMFIRRCTYMMTVLCVRVCVQEYYMYGSHTVCVYGCMGDGSIAVNVPVYVGQYMYGSVVCCVCISITVNVCIYVLYISIITVAYYMVYIFCKSR